LFRKLRERIRKVPKRYIIFTSIAVKLTEVVIVSILIKKFLLGSD